MIGASVPSLQLSNTYCTNPLLALNNLHVMSTAICVFQGHKHSNSDNGQPSKQKSIIVDRISGLVM